MNKIVVIETGYRFRGEETWKGLVINSYFKDVASAEKYLEQEGYEVAYGNVYSTLNDLELNLLARIVILNLIEV